VTDCYAIIVVEVILLILLIIALCKAHSKGPGVRVKRGPKSRHKFQIAYGFGTVIMLQIINSSNAFTGHKVLLSIINIIILCYLCFLNGWFRNKIICWISKWEEMWED